MTLSQAYYSAFQKVNDIDLTVKLIPIHAQLDELIKSDKLPAYDHLIHCIVTGITDMFISTSQTSNGVFGLWCNR